ncbi:nuclear transport factor 2 family protein [Microbacterium shaanxiense]
MNDITTAYLDTWNAPTTAATEELLERHWSVDATYVDPLAEVSGRESIGAVIAAVHEQFPGFVFSLVSGPDAHHSQTRFQWGLGPAGEEPLIIGFDVVTVDDEGRIRTVVGFLDRVPA